MSSSNETPLALSRRATLQLIGAGAAASVLPASNALAQERTPAAAAGAQGAIWRATTAGQPWRRRTVPALAAPDANPFAHDVTLALNRPRQTIAGFGGAFSELGWDALKALPAPRRAEALALLFGDDGCAFTQCRTPVGV